MEVHVQPRTRTKMFCGCAIGQLGDPPNSNVCEVCMGLPGVLPVINKAAVEACLKTALALDCAQALRTLLRTIGASEAEMEKGQLRAEPNISIRRYGSDDLGVKTELKNINSFRALHRAIEFEVKRQVEVVESGGAVVQETRGWSESEQRTFSQRSKEFAEDYRYFPEPDLPPLELDRAWIEDLRLALPELPGPRRARLVSEYGLPV